LNQYMDQLNNLGKLGIGAGGVLSSSGAYSEGKGTGGKEGIAGSILGAIAASDARLKTNIVPAGTDNAGVPMYYFDYRKDTGLKLPEGRFYGVMADEAISVLPTPPTSRGK
jgi:hypothetical protein